MKFHNKSIYITIFTHIRIIIECWCMLMWKEMAQCAHNSEMLQWRLTKSVYIVFQATSCSIPVERSSFVVYDCNSMLSGSMSTQCVAEAVGCLRWVTLNESRMYALIQKLSALCMPLFEITFALQARAIPSHRLLRSRSMVRACTTIPSPCRSGVWIRRP